MIKSDQLFRFYKRFHKEIEKTLSQQSLRIEKLVKVRYCFITSCFLKPLKIIYIYIYIYIYF